MPLYARSTILAGGREYAAGEQLPDQVSFMRRVRPIDADMLLREGLACEAPAADAAVADASASQA